MPYKQQIPVDRWQLLKHQKNECNRKEGGEEGKKKENRQTDD